MRRCPGCDFIYEDDETLCAMDGIGLVNHSGPLPFEESALPQSAAPTNSHGHGLTLIAASIILVIALFSYFRNVVKRNVLQSSPQAAKTYNPSQPGDQNPVVVIPVGTASPYITPSPIFTSTPPKADAPRKIYRTRQAHDHDPFRAPVETAIPSPRPLPSLTTTRIDVPSDKSVSSPVKPNLPSSESRPAPTPQKDINPANANQKNESKIVSFLKKAGRVLKKPFKH